MRATQTTLEVEVDDLVLSSSYLSWQVLQCAHFAYAVAAAALEQNFHCLHLCLSLDSGLQEFKKDQGVDLANDRLAVQRLREAAEKAKCELSSTTSTEVNLPFITADASGPKHLLMNITRAQYENMVDSLLERTKQPCLDCMKDAGALQATQVSLIAAIAVCTCMHSPDFGCKHNTSSLTAVNAVLWPVSQHVTCQMLDRAHVHADVTPGQVNEVLLVGGMTRMPKVHDIVKSIFQRDPSRGVNPDEVVAMGAAIQVCAHPLLGGHSCTWCAARHGMQRANCMLNAAVRTRVHIRIRNLQLQQFHE